MPNSVENRNQHFHAADQLDLVAYRSLSRAALVAAGFGLFSFTSILHPLLLIVPLVAFVAGGLALRSIAVSTAGLTGRRLALVGIVLAALFASGAVARLISRDRVVTTRARRFAHDWLQAVIDGRRELAFEMTLPPTMRQTPGLDLAEIYGSDPEKNEALQRFFDDSPIRELAEFGSPDKLHFEEVFEAGWDSNDGDFVGLEYRLDYREGGDPQSTRIQLVIQRKLHRKHGQGQWIVQQIGTAEEKQQRLETIRDLQSG